MIKLNASPVLLHAKINTVTMPEIIPATNLQSNVHLRELITNACKVVLLNIIRKLLKILKIKLN